MKVWIEGTKKMKPLLTPMSYCSKCGSHCKNLTKHQTYYYDDGFFCDPSDMD